MKLFNECVLKDEILECSDCSSYVKPDIVFFGESLPTNLY